MASTNITMRIDEDLKSQLQELMANLGMDMTTFFTLAAKQAVREQALPFQPRILNGINDRTAYQKALQNTTDQTIVSQKWQAFLRMEERKKEHSFPEDYDFEKEREEAVAEKSYR